MLESTYFAAGFGGLFGNLTAVEFLSAVVKPLGWSFPGDQSSTVATRESISQTKQGHSHMANYWCGSLSVIVLLVTICDIRSEMYILLAEHLAFSCITWIF